MGVKENYIYESISRSETYTRERKYSPKIISDWKVKVLAIVLYLILLFAMINVNLRAEKTLEYYIGAFATVSFFYMMFKIVLSFFYSPATEEPLKAHKVSVVIPSYNEDPHSVIKAIESILRQDYPVYEIIFIDDGSEDTSAFDHVKLLSEEVNSGFFEAGATYTDRIEQGVSPYQQTRIITHRLTNNRGKRHAQAWGFRRARGNIIMTADSDGYIFPDAVRELLKPFNDPDVTSVVGHINARNVDSSFMTRLQDILYHNAFRIGRASQSITNCVLVCSGALSMHRKDIVITHLDEFLEEKVMGITCKSGDDRCLTNLSLKYGGKTKYQSTALCITDVPVKTKNFFKQQVRWAKSFYLYTLESMKHAWNKPFMMMWLVCEGTLWIFFAVSQLISLFYWTKTYYLTVVIFTIGYFVLSSFISGIYYVFKNPLLYLATPIFTLMHMFLIFPIRLYALLTINKSKWGTR